MARQSAEAKITVLQGGLSRRPDAPDDLTEAQASIWTATVESEGPEFFNTAALRELLKDYCRHKVTAAALTEQVEKYDATSVMAPDVAQTFDRVTKMRDRETKAAADLATKLRLTNQSRYTPKAAATAAKNATVSKKPWDITSRDAG